MTTVTSPAKTTKTTKTPAAAALVQVTMAAALNRALADSLAADETRPPAPASGFPALSPTSS